MMSALLNGGRDHQVSRGEGGTFTVTSRGASEPALVLFQAIVEEFRVLARRGEIEIIAEHASNDIGVELVDRLSVRQS